MAERNASDSVERIEEQPNRSGGEASNNPPGDSRSASANRSTPRGTDEHPPRTRSTTETDSSEP